MSWYAITTRPNLEKTVAAGLEAKGLESWLPVYRVRIRWSDRIRQLKLPLFRGYAFCNHDYSRRIMILPCPGATGIVGFGSRPHFH